MVGYWILQDWSYKRRYHCSFFSKLKYDCSKVEFPFADTVSLNKFTSFTCLSCKPDWWLTCTISLFVSSDQCRNLVFTQGGFRNGKRLVSHVIHTTEVMFESSCRVLCYLDADCISYNVMKGVTNEPKQCELNNSTHKNYETNLKEHPGYIYHEAEVRNVVQVFKSII